MKKIKVKIKCEEQIEKCRKGIDTDEVVKNKLLREEFRRAFKVYIQKEDGDEDELHTNVLKESLENKQYIDATLSYDENDGVGINYAQCNINLKNVEGTENRKEMLPVLKVDKLSLNECDKNDKVTATNDNEADEIHFNTINFQTTNNESYDIIIDSKFKSTKANAKTGESLREIKSSYKIIVPNYEDMIWTKNKDSIYEFKYFSGNVRGITIGGNMLINNTDKLKGIIKKQNINDTVFNNKVYEKYRGGIQISGSKAGFYPVDEGKNVNIVTRGTLNADSNSEFYSSGSNSSLYAANVYLGKIYGDDKSAEKIVFNTGDIITDNDFTMNAENAQAEINNFYGINDKNTKNEKEEKERTSSSIIVNGYDEDSKVKINNDAYIMGTASIDTVEAYETGESTAVKGNYIAYAVPVAPDEVFKYDNPLQVLWKKDGKAATLTDKAKHFIDYWNGNGQDGIKISQNEVQNGGIEFDHPDRVHSVGAIVYKTGNTTSVQEQNLSIDDENDTVKEKRSDYAKNVYIFNTEDYDENYKFIQEYRAGEKGADKVQDLLKELKASDIITEDGWKTILNNASQDDKVAIFNPTNEEIVINKNLNGVIVTNGDVKIENGVTFNGDIIALGDLIIDNAGTVTIKYDEHIVDEVVGTNGDMFKQVFDKADSGKFIENTVSNNSGDDEGSEHITANVKTIETLGGKYDIKKYLKNVIWTLVK